jgi:hypothetical protein
MSSAYREHGPGGLSLLEIESCQWLLAFMLRVAVIMSLGLRSTGMYEEARARPLVRQSEVVHASLKRTRLLKRQLWVRIPAQTNAQVRRTVGFSERS